jgi:hypothetical protein
MLNHTLLVEAATYKSYGYVAATDSGEEPSQSRASERRSRGPLARVSANAIQPGHQLPLACERSPSPTQNIRDMSTYSVKTTSPSTALRT